MSDVAKAPYVQKTAAEKEVYKKELKAYKAAKKVSLPISYALDVHTSERS